MQKIVQWLCTPAVPLRQSATDILKIPFLPHYTAIKKHHKAIQLGPNLIF